MQIGRDLIAITENEFDRRQHKYLCSDPAIENENQVASTGEYLTKTYDFFYKADNYDPVFNEKLELEIGLTVQDALRHAIKVFNTMIKKKNLGMQLMEDPRYFMLCPANRAGERKDDYPALANDQLLNKTNLIRFVIVDNVFSEVRGIIYRGDNSQSGGKNNLSLGNTSIGKGLNGSAGQNDEEEIESGCLCCKRKKKKESKPSIKQPLLDGLKDTKV